MTLKYVKCTLPIYKMKKKEGIMTTNKILSITCIVAIASTLGLAYFWDDFLGGLSVNVSMDREHRFRRS